MVILGHIACYLEVFQAVCRAILSILSLLVAVGVMADSAVLRAPLDIRCALILLLDALLHVPLNHPDLVWGQKVRLLLSGKFLRWTL